MHGQQNIKTSWTLLCFTTATFLMHVNKDITWFVVNLSNFLDGFTSALFNDVWGRREEYIRFVGKNPKARDHLEELDIERRTILDCILKARIGRDWAGLIRLRIGANCGRFWTSNGCSVSLKLVLQIYWLAEERWAFQELCCIKLVI